MRLISYIFPQRRVYTVIMSGDSGPPLQSSIHSSDYELPEEMQQGKIISKSSSLDDDTKSTTNGNGISAQAHAEENVNEVTTVETKTLSMLEENNKVDSNGIDHTDNGKLVNEIDDDGCLVQCVYITQQCCECTII